MLSVAIHKDIAEYQPKVIGKLTGRTLISITVALGLSISVAVYMNLVLKIDPTDHLEFIYAVSGMNSLNRVRVGIKQSIRFFVHSPISNNVSIFSEASSSAAGRVKRPMRIV